MHCPPHLALDQVLRVLYFSSSPSFHSAVAPFQSSKPHPTVAEDEERLEKLFDRTHQLEKEESRTSLPEPVDTLATKMEALKEEEEEEEEKGERAREERREGRARYHRMSFNCVV